MATKFFGQFLLEQGVIDRKVLLDAIEYQKSINLPLCTLAVEKKLLSKEQLKQLDDEHRGSDTEFMQMAMKSGMLTFQQIQELGKAQSERWMFLGEALVRRGHLTLVQLDEFFDLYTKQPLFRESSLDDKLEGVPDKQIVSSFLSVTVDLFLHYTKQIVQVLSVEKGSDEPDEISYLFAQKVTGDRNFYYGLALPEDLMLSIARYMLQDDEHPIDAMSMDAVSEFVNVVIGNGCTKLNMKNAKVSAEPPQAMMKDMISKVLPPNTVSVKMKTARGMFQVLFFFAGENGELPKSLM